MNILVTIFGILIAVVGAGSIILIVAALIGTIAKKIYRCIRYGASIYD